MNPQESYQAVLKEVKKRIAGKEDVIELMFIAILSDGHVLLEGVPGVAKTTMARTLSEAIQVRFDRVQGTSDLEYKDIVGFTYMDEKDHQVKLRPGPIFTNILLIDELNRAPPKVASALLQSLEEREVTFSDRTLPLEKPFIAIATQNPLSIEGTMPIPKVLADRFLLRIGVQYPSEEEERQMLHIKESGVDAPIEKVMNAADIMNMQAAVNSVKMPESIINYITDIVTATRNELHLIMGASPRAEISFMKAGRARAMISGRNEVTADDIKFLAKPILSHRLTVRSTGGIGVNGIIDGIIASVHPSEG